MPAINARKDRLTQSAQTGLTATSDPVIVEPSAKITIYANLTSGSPTTGAKLQFTGDTEELIVAGTATWIDADRGNSRASFSDNEPAPSNITGVRLVVTDGTWRFVVHQGFVR